MKKHIYKWVKNNRDKVREIQRKNASNYYENNKEMILTKRKERREKNRPYIEQCKIFRNILI
jgi:hypothetical protein